MLLYFDGTKLYISCKITKTVCGKRLKKVVFMVNGGYKNAFVIFMGVDFCCIMNIWGHKNAPIGSFIILPIKDTFFTL